MHIVNSGSDYLGMARCFNAQGNKCSQLTNFLILV